MRVAQQRTGAIVWIILGIAIPILILGAYVALNREPTESPIAEKDPGDATERTERPETDGLAASEKVSEEPAPAASDESPPIDEITPAQWETIAAMEFLGGRFRNKALAELRFIAEWRRALPDRALELEQLTDFAALRTLSISGAILTDSELQQLGALDQLTELTLTQNAITDAGLGHLMSLSNLKTLVIEQLSITDAGLAHLEKLPGLKNLEIYSSDITDAGIKKLRAALPTCQIKGGHDGTPTRIVYMSKDEFVELAAGKTRR
jgi:hypothetical protein